VLRLLFTAATVVSDDVQWHSALTSVVVLSGQWAVATYRVDPSASIVADAGATVIEVGYSKGSSGPVTGRGGVAAGSWRA